MAVKTIDELAAANNIADTDVFIIDDGARNYKVAWSVLKRLIGSISNFTVDNTVGTITITLSTGASLTVTPHDQTKQDKLTFDSTPTAGSSNPVTSGGIKAALDDKLDAEDYAVFTGANASTAGSAGIVPAPAAGDTRFLSSSGAWTAPDSTPTAGSSNLPTSGGVKTALDGKQDELTFDTTPTEDSTNPVTSGGVFDAIKQSTATKDIGSLFTERDSHVSRLNARQSGKMVTLSCTITAGVANGAKLFDIAPSIEPSFGDWIAPLYKGSGEQITYGSAWIYRTQNLQATYYGSQATNAELTFDLCYLAK